MYNKLMIKKILTILSACSIGLFPLFTSATTFVLTEGSRVVGYNLVVYSRSQDTLLDIARSFDVGYTEIVNANPGVDVWLPGAGQKVLVPNQFILPNTRQKGLVINLAEMRLYYFPETKNNEVKTVSTYPIGIGREGWQTPLGKAKITQKRKNPTWTPPKSIKAEHLANGDPLPDVVPAGPNNPLGDYAMRLSMPGYLLHGTNKPYGVGLRVSHGCIRLYPEDIKQLFGVVPMHAPVEIVYQPYKAAMHEGQLYVEAHETHDDMQTGQNNMTPMVKAVIDARGELADDDWLFAQAMIDHQLGTVQRLGALENKMVDDVWFVHTGTAESDKAELHALLTTLHYEDLFWPVRGAMADTVIGPFESYEQAEVLADKIYNGTKASAWVAQLPAEAL